MTGAEREHGTYATYQWHRRKGVPMCEPCREANRAYHKAWLEDPEARSRHHTDSAANSRALWRLARIYPYEFQALVAEERVKGGAA